MDRIDNLLHETSGWLEDFCREHGFTDKSGRTKYSRALNLMLGFDGKTKKERAFKDALLAELGRRRSEPDESYNLATFGKIFSVSRQALIDRQAGRSTTVH